MLHRHESSAVPVEGSDSPRARRFAHGPSDETRLQFVERVSDAYGLVLVLILTTFVVSMTLPPEGWGGRLVAAAVAGLTAIIALTSSDVRPGRVRLAFGAALAAVLATAIARAVSSDALLGIAFLVDSLLLAAAAITIMRGLYSPHRSISERSSARSASSRSSAFCSAFSFSRSDA